MNREQMLAKIDSSWYELAELVSDIDGCALSSARQDGWSIKDHLVHLAAWELSLLALIEGHDRVSAMGIPVLDPADTNEINEAVWKLHRNESVDDVLFYFCDSHERLRTVLTRLSSTELLLPYSYYQPSRPERQQAVMGWVAGNTFEHYAEHKSWIKEMLAAG